MRQEAIYMRQRQKVMNLLSPILLVSASGNAPSVLSFACTFAEKDWQAIAIHSRKMKVQELMATAQKQPA
jgi:hypothetical protein